MLAFIGYTLTPPPLGVLKLTDSSSLDGRTLFTCISPPSFVCGLQLARHYPSKPFHLNNSPLPYNADVGPEVLVFALCGFGLEESRRQAAKAIEKLVSSCDAEVAAVARRARVIVTDGLRVFSRPGPWLVPSLEVLVEALHGEAQGFGHEGRLWALLTGGGVRSHGST